MGSRYQTHTQRTKNAHKNTLKTLKLCLIKNSSQNYIQNRILPYYIIGSSTHKKSSLLGTLNCLFDGLLSHEATGEDL